MSTCCLPLLAVLKSASLEWYKDRYPWSNSLLILRLSHGEDAQSLPQPLETVSCTSHGVTGPADDILESTISAWNASPEKITQCLEHSLDARQGVDRNANLGILVDAWTAKLERI